MDESTVKHLEQPVKKMKLSAAIRKGHELIPENHSSYDYCALGAANMALTGTLFKIWEVMTEYGSAENYIAQATDTPLHTVRLAEQKHRTLNIPRLQIASWLESIGY